VRDYQRHERKLKTPKIVNFFTTRSLDITHHQFFGYYYYNIGYSTPPPSIGIYQTLSRLRSTILSTIYYYNIIIFYSRVSRGQLESREINCAFFPSCTLLENASRGDTKKFELSCDSTVVTMIIAMCGHHVSYNIIIITIVIPPYPSVGEDRPRENRTKSGKIHGRADGRRDAHMSPARWPAVRGVLLKRTKPRRDHLTIVFHVGENPFGGRGGGGSAVGLTSADGVGPRKHSRGSCIIIIIIIIIMRPRAAVRAPPPLPSLRRFINNTKSTIRSYCIII